MDDVTRRWPRRTTLVVVPEPSTRRDRAERDAATVAALRAYLQVASPPRDARVDVRL